MEPRDAFYLVKGLQIDIDNMGPSTDSSNESNPDGVRFYEFVLDADLRSKTEKLFLDGHYARAVEEAYKFIDNLVKRRVRKLCSATSGSSLMRTAFSPKKPILMLNENLTEVDVDEQQGYMDILAGCMTGIRNPRAHDTDLDDDRDYALKLLSWADHLVLRIKNAKVNNGLKEEDSDAYS